MRKPDSAPTIHVIGHITRDIIGPNESAQGGTVSYLAAALHNLDSFRIIAYAPCPDDPNGPYPYLQRLRDMGMEAYSLNPEDTDFTTFINTVDEYLGRIQQCLYVNEIITPEHFERQGIQLPENDICVLASVMREISPELIRELWKRGNKLIGIPQGFFRQREEGTDRVLPHVSLELLDEADKFALLVFSDEDVRNLPNGYVGELQRRPNATIMTQGENGCTLYLPHEEVLTFPAYPLTAEATRLMRTADETVRKNVGTGLGDVFAATLIYGLHIHRNEANPWERAIQTATLEATLKMNNGIYEGRGGITGAPSAAELRTFIAREQLAGRLGNEFRLPALHAESIRPRKEAIL